VARGTADAFIDVNAVIEINEVGKPLDLHPLDRFICPVALANGFQVRSVGKQHGMAIHAGLCGRNACKGGGLNRGMTIAAVQSVIANVVLVAELHGLLTHDVLIRRIGRTRKPQNAREPQSDQKNSREQAEFRDEICAAMKNLGHVSVALLRRPLPEGAKAWRLRSVMAGKCAPGSQLTA